MDADCAEDYGGGVFFLDWCTALAFLTDADSCRSCLAKIADMTDWICLILLQTTEVGVILFVIPDLEGASKLLVY